MILLITNDCLSAIIFGYVSNLEWKELVLSDENMGIVYCSFRVLLLFRLLLIEEVLLHSVGRLRPFGLDLLKPKIINLLILWLWLQICYVLACISIFYLFLVHKLLFFLLHYQPPRNYHQVHSLDLWYYHYKHFRQVL